MHGTKINIQYSSILFSLLARKFNEHSNTTGAIQYTHPHNYLTKQK
jgi:hypothetical protein